MRSVKRFSVAFCSTLSFLLLLGTLFASTANAVIVNVGGGVPTGMEIEDVPDAAANKTTDDANTDGTGVSYDWNDILDGTHPGPYEHTQSLEVDPIGNPGVFTSFTFRSLGVVESVFRTDDTAEGLGCAGGNEDGFGGGAKIDDNPYVPIITDPNNKTDSCSGAAALEIVDQINNDTGEEQNHYILYNYWSRSYTATGDMTTYQVLRGPTQFNPDTLNPVLGTDPEYRCDDFLVQFDFDPNNNVVSVASLTWKPDGSGAPPYSNAQCAGPGEWQLFDSDFDGAPGPDTGGGVGNFGFNVDPVDTGDNAAKEGTFGESGVDLTALGILSDEGPCATFTNQGFITATGNSAAAAISDIMAYGAPLAITNCTDVQISKVGNTTSAEDFTYVLDQKDGLNVHDGTGATEANGDGVDIDGVQTAITSLINIDDIHLWQEVLSQPDYLLGESVLPTDWTLDTIVCTYWDAFDQIERVDQILPEQNDGPWDEAGGVDDPDVFEIPPAQANNNGQITSCVINNVTSGLIVEKIISQGAIGTATLAGFDVSVDGTEVLWTTPGSTTGGIEQVTATAGTYTLSEADLGSYTEGTWSCKDGLDADVSVTNGGLFSGADVTVADGQIVTCSITNERLARLTVVKNTAGGNGSFDFSSTQLGLFTLDTLLANTAQTTFDDLVPAIDYDLAEFYSNSDWSVGSASCSSGTGTFSDDGQGLAGFVDISLSAGEHVICTFNNIAQGSSSLTKISIGGIDSFDFTSNLPNLPSMDGSFSLTTSGDQSGGTSSPLAGSGLVPGFDYFVTETTKANWTLTDISCTPTGAGTTWSSNLPARTLLFNLGNGGTINCSFTNIKDGTVIVEKQTVGGDPADEFTFEGDLAGPLLDGETITLSGNFALAATSMEVVPPDYTLTDISCTGGTNASTVLIGGTASFVADDNDISVLPAPGETVTCVFTNTKKGTITVVKEISAVGPAIQVFPFTSNLPGNATFDLSPVDAATSDDLMVIDLIPGTYSVNETDPTSIGWAMISATCDDNSPVGTIDLAAGEDIICTFVNAPLGSATIVKTTVGADGGPFEFTWGNGTNTSVPEGSASTFTLTTPGATATRDFTNKLLIDNPYDLAETSLPVAVGPYSQTWNLTNTGCVDATADTSVPGANGADATIVAASNETVSCTFTNTLDGTLVIRKQTLPDGNTTDFAFSGSHAGLAGNLQDFDNAAAELSETGAPGIYGTAETVPNGWVLTDIACTGATNSTVQIGNTNAFVKGDELVQVDLAAGETVICTYTNTREGSLTIIKDAVGGDGQFTYNHTVPNVASPFIINTAVDDTNIVSTTLLPGTYLTTEVVPTGWDLTNIVCTGNTDSTITIGGAGAFDPGDTAVTVDMLSGEDITCTFTNVKQATLIVEKLTDPDTSIQGFSFTGDVSGGPIAHGQTLMTENLSPGTYTSTETPVAGWDLTDITCDDDESASPSTGDIGTGIATFNADPGEIITCTFTNTIQAAQIIVDKQTAPTGSPVLFDFTLTGANVNQAFQLADATTAYNSGDLLPMSENGAYNVAETLPADWSAVSATCSDGSDPTAVDLNPGEVVTCTFVNAQAGQSTFTKLTLGGDDTFNFTTDLPNGNFALTTSGGTSPKASTGMLPAGTYTITEDVLAGWDLTDMSCTEDDTQDSVIDIPNRTITLNVQDGETINCTFTNTLLPIINLAKTVNGPAVLEGDGTYTVVYMIVASNSGGPGMYNLVDAFSPGSGITLNTATALYVAGTENDQSGTLGMYPNFVTDEDLDTGLNESWTVTANFTIDLALVTAEGSDCDPTNAGTENTGFTNTVSGSSTDTDLTDNTACTELELPTLTLMKAIDGGEALPADFVLTLTGADGIHDAGVDHASGDSMIVKPGVAYTLSEAADQVEDYFENGIVCVDDADQSALPHPVTLGDKQSVTCTLTNTANELVFNVLAEACINNAPYLDYDITTTEGNDTEVDITWIKDDGSDEVVETLLSQPLAGFILWPGAAIVDGVAVAWPGWSCDAEGQNCVQVDDGLVPTMQVRFEINPTETIVVDYPPATAGCQGNPPVLDYVPIPVPVNDKLALLLLTLMLLATGWYFRPAGTRKF